MKKQKKKRFKFWFLVLPLVILNFFISCFGLTSSLVANAVTVTGYTGVLSDLRIDDNFNEEDFPVNAEDTNLELIQIAESTGGELFIYTYQPSAKEYQFELTTISISQTLYNNAKWELYDLKLIDSDGVFAKYKVKGIDLKSDVVRYYDITEIHRKFNEEIDSQPDNGNTITEVAINVSKQWTVCTLEGKVYYECIETETILITDKYVGFVEYEDGFSLSSLFFNTSCHSHFVAFSTDHDIDRLIEADVSFVSQSRFYYPEFIDLVESYEPTFGSVTNNSITLNYTDKAEYNTSHWFTKYTYSWDRIQSVDEFFNSTSDVDIYSSTLLNTYGKNLLTEEAKSKMNDMQWVLRFTETRYIEDIIKPGLASSIETVMSIEDTIVSDVTILRLKFETDGIVYNLGVVDNKANGSGISDSYMDWTVEVSDTFKEIMKAVGYILLIILVVVLLSLLGVLAPIFKFIWNCILKLLKVVWWVLSSPIYLFKNKK